MSITRKLLIVYKLLTGWDHSGLLNHTGLGRAGPPKIFNFSIAVMLRTCFRASYNGNEKWEWVVIEISYIIFPSRKWASREMGLAEVGRAGPKVVIRDVVFFKGNVPGRSG